MLPLASSWNQLGVKVGNPRELPGDRGFGDCWAKTSSVPVKCLTHAYFHLFTASSIGKNVLGVYELGGATIVECPPKTSKNHAHVLQVSLADSTEMLLAINTPENLRRWLRHLKTTAGKPPFYIYLPIQPLTGQISHETKRLMLIAAFAVHSLKTHSG